MILSKNTIKISLVITATLIVYFLALTLLDVSDNVIYSFLNAPIMAIGLFFIIRESYREKTSQFKYMEGFTSGLAGGFLATILFTVFMAIYLLEIHPSLVEEMSASLPLATGTGNMEILLFIFLSGISTAVVSSLLIIPIYKRSWNTSTIRKNQKPLHQDF